MERSPALEIVKNYHRAWTSGDVEPEGKRAYRNFTAGCAQQLLIERIRGKLAGEPVLREVSMFGGHQFMVNEKLLVGALKDGALLVHADPANHAGLLLRPGAKQAEMGTGRSMGPGWIRVDAAGIEKDAALTSWLHTALEFNRAVTGNGR